MLNVLVHVIQVAWHFVNRGTSSTSFAHLVYDFALYSDWSTLIYINLTDIETLLSAAHICEPDSLTTQCFRITRWSYVQFSISNSCNLLQDISWPIIEWYLEPIASISITCLHYSKGILAGKLTSHWLNTTHDVWQHCWPKWQAKRCGWWAPYPLLIYDQIYSITFILCWCCSPCSYHSWHSSFYSSTLTFNEDTWSWQCCII